MSLPFHHYAEHSQSAFFIWPVFRKTLLSRATHSRFTDSLSSTPFLIAPCTPMRVTPPRASKRGMSGHRGCYSPDLGGLFPQLQQDNYTEVSNRFKTIINRKIPILVDVFFHLFRSFPLSLGLVAHVDLLGNRTRGVTQGVGKKLQERGNQSQAKHGRIGHV